MDTAISLLQEMWATFALGQAHTLADLGIHPLASWTLVAACPRHGRQTLDLVETTERPGWHEYIKCDNCVDRWLEITSWEPR